MVQEKTLRDLAEMTAREMDLLKKYRKEAEDTSDESMKKLYQELINECETRATKYYKIANELG